jgi:TP901 family phage tail tape measure protein
MAEKFSITGQITLAAPANLKQVSSAIKKELQKPIALQLNADSSIKKVASKVRTQIQKLVKPEITFQYKSKNLQRIRQQIQKDVNNNPIRLKVKVDNLKEVSDQISNYLKGRVIPIKVRLEGEKSISSAAEKVSRLDNTVDQTTDSMANLGRQTAITVRRFGAYTAATAVFFKLSSSIREGVSDAIAFEKQLIKVRQVTGESIFSLGKLTDEIDRLAVGFGVSSTELLNASQVLSQAGFSANQVRVALSTLAKTDLSPTFENITQSTEGAIAVLNQFGLAVEDLEGVFDSLNTVAAKFAVESGDLITAIRTAGGVFASTGDSVEDLEALFTAVRQTTRASASSIAVGLRTISTRLQRGRTQNFLRDLGIDLRFAGEEARKAGKEGLFVGVFESFRRISNALRSIPRNDPRFAQIAEELGGFRQIDKVIPLITQFELAERVRGEAIRATGSLTRDATTAQESFANQLAKTREEFDALIRTVINSDAFKALSQLALGLTRTFVRLAESIEALSLALVTGLATASINPLKRFTTAFGGSISRPQKTFLNTGGFVPGVGNKDTVPAMLTPGEYVINKKAAKALGDKRLDLLNQGKIPRYNSGGKVGGVQKFQAGGRVANAGLIGAVSVVGIQLLSDQFGEASKAVKDFTIGLAGSVVQFGVFSSLLNNSSRSIRSLEESIETTSKEAEELGAGFARNRSESNKQLATLPSTTFGDVRNAKTELDNQRRLATSGGGLTASNSKALRVAEENFKATKKEFDAKLRAIGVINEERIAKDQALKAEINSKKELVNANKNTIKTINSLNAGISIAASGFTLLSGFLESFAADRLQRLRSGESVDVESARFSAGVAGGARGAATGAFVGGFAASSALGGTALSGLAGLTGISALGGPVGIGVVAGLAALGTGIYSTISAINDFDKELRAIRIDTFSSNLAKVLEEISNEETTPFASGNRVLSNLGGLRARLQTETDTELRGDINAAINNSLQGIQVFINKARDASVSFEQFNNTIPTDTLRFFARRTGQSFEDLVSSIRTVIAAQDTFSTQFTESVLNAQAFETRIRTEVALTNAIKGTILGINNLNSTFSSLSGGSSSGPGTNVLSSQLGNIGAVSNLGDFNRRLLEFSSGFGRSSSILVSDTIDASKALKVLPSLLLQVRRQTLAGSDKPIIDTLADQLDNAGIGSSVRDAIIARIDELGGPNNDDAKIIDAIGKDLTGVLTTITNSLSRVGSSIEEVNNKIFTELGALSSGLQSANDQIASAQSRRVAAAGLPAALSSIISERPNFGVRQAALNNQQNIATGGRGGQQAFDDLVRSQENLVRINNELAATSDPEKQRQLVNLQAQQIANIRSANTALDFLADAAKRASVLEAELNKERADRQVRGNLAERIAFGSADSNRSIRQNVALAREAGRTGSLQNIPQELREELLSFLKSLGDTTIAGLGGFSGQDIIDRVTQNQLAAAGIDPRGITAPSERESQLTSQISAIFQQAQKIEEARANREVELAQNFFKTLNSEFKTFLDNLRKVVRDEQVSSIDESISTREGQLLNLRKLAEDAGKLTRLSGGTNTETLVSSFPQIISAVDELSEVRSVVNQLKDLNVSQFVDQQAGLLDEDGAQRGRYGARGFQQALSEINKALVGIESTFGKDFASEIRSRIFDDGEISQLRGFSLTSGEFSRSRVNSLLTGLIESTGDTFNIRSATAARTLRDQAANVGGSERVTAIVRNREELSKILSTLPENVKFDELTQSIKNLTNEINVLRSTRRGFNSGGVVPGIGDSDTVPAMLTPGEVVLNKSAVQKIGLQNALSLNQTGKGVQRFNQGGLVQSQNFDGFNSSVNVFLTGVTRLAESLANIPTEIEMRGTHRVEVVIMGAQVLNEIMPSVSQLVEGKINKAMNDFVAKRFPEQGPYTGVI